MNTLSEAANAAGLKDPDLLALARTDVRPEQAVAELRSKYPGAFVPAATSTWREQTRGMTHREKAAWLDEGMKELRAREFAEARRRADAATYARLERELGRKSK